MDRQLSRDSASYLQYYYQYNTITTVALSHNRLITFNYYIYTNSHNIILFNNYINCNILII
jgi:hypothetical protein